MNIPCVLCNKTGRHFNFSHTELCPICRGRLEVVIAGSPALHTCPVCKGNGRHFAYSNTELCATCHGIARLKENGKPPTIVEAGQLPPAEPSDRTTGTTIIAESRLNELRGLKSAGFDLRRLLRMCQEINTCYGAGCYFATIMLTRSLLDHVPPLFGYPTFKEAANNYTGTKSFKESMQHLDAAARKIADSVLHTNIRASEILPTPQQVNFGPELDVLLAEIVRITR
jgi:hypothetical protein